MLLGALVCKVLTCAFWAVFPTGSQYFGNCIYSDQRTRESKVGRTLALQAVYARFHCDIASLSLLPGMSTQAQIRFENSWVWPKLAIKIFRFWSHTQRCGSVFLSYLVCVPWTISSAGAWTGDGHIQGNHLISFSISAATETIHIVRGVIETNMTWDILNKSLNT